MRNSLKVAALCLCIVLISAGCATYGPNGRPSNAGSAALGCGAVGAFLGGVVSAVTGTGNPWQVSLLSGLGAGALCGTVAAINERSMAQAAAQQGTTVRAVNNSTGERFESTPVYQTQQGRCTITRTTKWRNGQKISEQDHEVCSQTHQKDIRR